MKNYENIFIDLDGTIINSQEGVVKSLKYSLEKMNVTNYNEEILKTFIGPPLTFSFKDKFGFDKEQTAEAIKFYRERYTSKGMFECHVYEGFEESLVRLIDGGKRLFVATSKPELFAKKILDYQNLTKYFHKIYGASLNGNIVEKEDVIEYALADDKSISKEKTIMVGDTKYDIIGANKIGLDSMGVLYGFGSIEEFYEHKATYIAKTTSEIADLLLGK